MHPEVRGGANVWGLSPTLRDIPSLPRGSEDPLLQRENRKSRPGGGRPEVPPLDG